MSKSPPAVLLASAIGTAMAMFIAGSGFATDRSTPLGCRLPQNQIRLPQGGRFCLEHDPEKWEPVFRKDHAQKSAPKTYSSLSRLRNRSFARSVRTGRGKA